jgi:hypothetical protein
VVGPEPRISDKALWAYMVWQDWQAAVKLRPLAIEQVVWSTTYRFAGTLDFLAEITLPGHVAPVPVVGDIKTGKAIYDEAGLQVSAYVAALREMEHAPPGVWAAVVRLHKIESDPDVRNSPDLAGGAGGPVRDLPSRAGPLELAASPARGRGAGGVMPTSAQIAATPAADQDLVRALLLRLIDLHLRRASTDALQALERDLQTVPRAGS